MPITESDLSEVYEGDVLSASGEKIGSVGQIYLDDQTGEPTFVTANTGLFGLSQSFVPLRGARVENGNVVVDFDKTTVKDAPRVDDDGSLAPAEEDQLYAYYGMTTASPDTGDYATVDQTPEPGYARAARDDSRPGESRLGDRTDELGADPGTGGRDARSDEWGDRPVGADERTAAAGTSESDGIARKGSGGFGALESGTENRTDELGADPASSGRDTRPDEWGDRPVGADERAAAAGTSESDGIAREGSGGFGAVGAGTDDREDKTTPDASPADHGPTDGGPDDERTDEQGSPSRQGRLRKWVMTEYEPVKSEEVYVEGSGQPGERPTP